MNRSIIWAALTGLVPFLLGGLFACNGDGPTDVDPGGSLASITIAPDAETLVSLNETLELSATARNAQGAALTGVEVAWESQDPQVATVSQAGLVTAASNGTATITASAGGVSGMALITVEQEPAAAEASSGDAQSGIVAQPLDSALVVRVTDALGSPVGGVSVAFSVTDGGGSVSPEEGVTDDQGEVVTAWTLGETAGVLEMSAAVVSSADVSIGLSATATPDDPVSMVLHDGDDQFELPGMPLPAPIRVRLVDQFGNGVPDIEVTFTVGSDDFLEESEAVTDVEGIAEASWTLGAGLGPYQAQATAFMVPDSTVQEPEVLPGSPVDFTAAAVAYAVGSVESNLGLVADTMTVLGMGFDPDPTSNTVTVGGEEAEVVDGTQTSLSVIVPSFGCAPAQDRTVVVTRGASSASVQVEVEPEEALRLPVGGRRVLADPADYCLQFLAGDTEAEYVIGLTATRPLAGEMLLSLFASDEALVAPAPVAAARAPSAAAGDPDPVDSPEMALRGWEADFLSTGSTAISGGALGSDLASSSQVGDVLSLSVPDITANPCTDFASVAPVVRGVGPRAVVATDFQTGPLFESLVEGVLSPFMELFGDFIWEFVTSYFGAMPDLGPDDRIILVFTPAAQSMGVPAFTTVVDQLPAADCPASDEAFIIYVATPAEMTAVQFGDLLRDRAPDLAHNLTHVIQHARRLSIGGGALPLWLGEGQAQTAIEIVGMAIRGDELGSNYGWDVVNTAVGGRWYRPRFDGLSYLFGWDGAGGSLEGAPDRCSLYGFGGFLVPCDPEYAAGMSWAFVRYLADRFGDGFPGGQPALQQALIDADPSADFLETVQELTGSPVAEIAVDWAMTLFVDGRLPDGAGPTMGFPSWDLADIYGNLPVEQRLTAPTFDFEPFTRSTSVIGGGTSYTLISAPGAHGALAVRVRDPNGGILSPALAPRLWVVRIR